MNRFAKTLVGAVVATALLVGGVASAANAYPPGTAPSVTAPSTAKAGAAVTVKGTKFKPGAAVKVTLGSKSVKLTANSSGAVSGKITAPKSAGKYKIVVASAGEKTISKALTIGKAYSKASAKASTIWYKNTTSRWVTLTGAKNAKVLVKISGPKGSKAVTKTVKLNSKGKAWYKYTGATKKGKYTITVTYKPTATKYGAKTYTSTFTKKK